MSDLERAIEAFRAALARRDASAAAELARAYGAAYGRISARLADLFKLAESSQGLTAAQLVRSRRYRALLRQIEDELAAYGVTATEVVTRSQAAAVALAADHAEALARAALGPPPASVSVRWNALPAEAFSDLVGALQDGSPLRSLFDALGREASTKAGEVLTSGLAQGLNPRVVARQLRQASGMSLTRALTVSRTEMLRAYRTSSIRGYAANPQLVKAWRWSCARQRRTCALCWAMHGHTFPLSVPFGSHANCRCAAVPVTASWAELGFSGVPDAPVPPTGPEVFEGLPQDWQRSILGAGKYDLYAAGRLRLADIVGERVDPRWGLIRFERPLQEVSRV